MEVYVTYPREGIKKHPKILTDSEGKKYPAMVPQIINVTLMFGPDADKMAKAINLAPGFKSMDQGMPVWRLSKKKYKQARKLGAIIVSEPSGMSDEADEASDDSE